VPSPPSPEGPGPPADMLSPLAQAYLLQLSSAYADGAPPAPFLSLSHPTAVANDPPPPRHTRHRPPDGHQGAKKDQGSCFDEPPSHKRNQLIACVCVLGSLTGLLGILLGGSSPEDMSSFPIRSVGTSTVQPNNADIAHRGFRFLEKSMEPCQAVPYRAGRSLPGDPPVHGCPPGSKGTGLRGGRGTITTHGEGPSSERVGDGPDAPVQPPVPGARPPPYRPCPPACPGPPEPHARGPSRMSSPQPTADQRPAVRWVPSKLVPSPSQRWVGVPPRPRRHASPAPGGPACGAGPAGRRCVQPQPSRGGGM